MTIAAWITIGLVAGVAGGLSLPGRRPGRVVEAAALGIIGALAGGWIAGRLAMAVGNFSFYSLFVPVAGAVGLLGVAKMLRMSHA